MPGACMDMVHSRPQRNQSAGGHGYLFEKGSPSQGGIGKRGGDRERRLIRTVEERGNSRRARKERQKRGYFRRLGRGRSTGTRIFISDGVVVTEKEQKVAYWKADDVPAERTS